MALQGPAQGAENKDDERSLALGSEGTSQGSLTGLGAGSFFRRPLWVGPWYSSSLGIVLLEQPGVVLLGQHGKVLLQLHWMILPKQPGEVLLEQFGVLLIKQGGMVLLNQHGMVLLEQHGMALLRQHGMALLEHSGMVLVEHGMVLLEQRVWWVCLSTMEQLQVAGIVLHVLQHPKQCIQSHSWPFLPLLEILHCWK